MFNKILVAQLVGLLFAVLADAGVVLPPSFTEAGMIELVMAAIAAITIVLRFVHGDPLDDAMEWWRSRTLWASGVALVFAVLALAGIVPTVDQDRVVAGVMAALTLVGSWYGTQATKALR